MMLVIRIPYPEVAIEPIDPATVSLGAWYDPSDLSSLWKDTSATDPVTTPGDAVARIDDKSGNGGHLTQTTAGSRPLYQMDSSGNPYLLFDGVDDNIWGTLTGFASFPFDRISAIRQVSSTSFARIFSHGGGAAQLLQRSSPTVEINDGTLGVVNTGDLAVGTNGIVTERHIANGSKIAVNNRAYAAGDAGATAPTSGQLRIGAINASGSNSPSNIRFYGCVMKDGTLTDDEVLGLRAWLAGKAGVTL